ncbi:2OG-Fe(II) oxygenase superfamily-domain-containing protein [Hyaloraphidium curvatum]|nr:2OG-Fe(II) oxygenase superfamily-domain-containing protein [Hyaloraphidium curvatum]
MPDKALSNSALKRLRKQRDARPSLDDPAVAERLSAFRIEERRWKRAAVEELHSVDSGRLDECSLRIADFGVPERALRCNLDPLAVDWDTAIGAASPGYRELFRTWLANASSEAYCLPSHPGLILLPCPFTERAQRELVSLSCREWTRRPSVSNLDNHWDLDMESDNGQGPVNLWELFERAHRSGGRDAVVVPLKPQAADGEETADPYRRLNVPTLAPLPIMDLIHKMRWTSIGLAYEWFSKTYNLDKQGPPVPDLLASLCRVIVRAVESISGYPESRYIPQAGVVNFYSHDSALHSHQDRSEPNSEAPLVSISLGTPCVFLMGGMTVDERPDAVWLRSGDIVVMSGSSRRCFHGVPRVFSNGRGMDLEATGEEDGDAWEPVKSFMSDPAPKRININVRQVF